jgi:hypothetical protein
MTIGCNAIYGIYVRIEMVHEERDVRNKIE